MPSLPTRVDTDVPTQSAPTGDESPTNATVLGHSSSTNATTNRSDIEADEAAESSTAAAAPDLASSTHAATSDASIRQEVPLHGVDEAEPPQSSKRRRDRRDIEAAERRRLDKSLSLFPPPVTVSGDCGAERIGPSKRLRINTMPLLHLSDSPCTLHSHSHSSAFLHNFASSNPSLSHLGSSPSKISSLDTEPRSSSIHCQKRLSPVGSSAGSDAVVCILDPQVESDPTTYGQRPPEVS